jgi:hypothetical protein
MEQREPAVVIRCAPKRALSTMARRISRHLPAIDPQGCERASFDEAPRAEVRLDDMQFALSALQPRATVGPSSAVTIHSTLRRLHAVLRAIEVGHGVLVRLWPCALLARPFRRPLLHLGEDGRPELVPATHCASQSYPAFRAPFAARRSASLAGFFADLLGEPRPFRSAERSWPCRSENLVRQNWSPYTPSGYYEWETSSARCENLSELLGFQHLHA